VIDSREYACPECGGHGHIVVEEDGKLRCGACEHRYTEAQALDLTSEKSQKSGGDA